MTDPANNPETPKQRHVQEYEDPHYHDDDELSADEEGRPKMSRPAARRKLPPRRRYEDD
jgi:hypothetical protein